MCGRINIRMSSAELAAVFDLFREPVWTPRYNLGPMQKTLIIRRNPEGLRWAESVQWGLVPSWAQDPRIGSQMFNARAETVATKPAFRSSFRKRRCLVPASGFYEWQQLDGKAKQPWNIFRADGQPLAFAGLWEHWQNPDGTVLESCTVITTTANSFMAEIHDRMPVILDKQAWGLWLSPEELPAEALTELLVPCPSDWLDRTPVSTLVNNVRNESADCVRPIDTPRTLF
ncbi:MAG: SOS response-associated peptidase [Planctomycetes bacterium]|nr:SOS response-associated peptidase [Planctomycetota bacterium]